MKNKNIEKLFREKKNKSSFKNPRKSLSHWSIYREIFPDSHYCRPLIIQTGLGHPILVPCWPTSALLLQALLLFAIIWQSRDNTLIGNFLLTLCHLTSFPCLPKHAIHIALLIRKKPNNTKLARLQRCE